jgi:hypothetical protein
MAPTHTLPCWRPTTGTAVRTRRRASCCWRSCRRPSTACLCSCAARRQTSWHCCSQRACGACTSTRASLAASFATAAFHDALRGHEGLVAALRASPGERLVATGFRVELPGDGRVCGHDVYVAHGCPSSDAASCCLRPGWIARLTCWWADGALRVLAKHLGPARGSGRPGVDKGIWLVR